MVYRWCQQTMFLLPTIVHQIDRIEDDPGMCQTYLVHRIAFLLAMVLLWNDRIADDAGMYQTYLVHRWSPWTACLLKTAVF